MKAEKIANGVRVDTDKYILEIDTEQLLARLDVKESGLYYYMSLLSAVDTIEKVDETSAVRLLGVEESTDYVILEIGLESNIWAEKTMVYTCLEDSLECGLVVKGKGKIDRVYYFRGNFNGNEFGSIPGFDYVFPACTNFLEKNYFHVSEYTSINTGHEDFAWGFAMNSGPLCFAFTNDFESPWLSVGLAPKENEYGFQSFEFNHKPASVQKEHDSILGTQSFSISYYGHKKVAGDWNAPKLILNFADDKYAGVEKYVQSLFNRNYLSKCKKEIVNWWRKPIVCGWHEQVANGLACSQESNMSKQALEAGPLAFSECTQENYEHWLGILDKHNIKPGTIVIDAMWQIAVDTYEVDAVKWPDLRGFIDQCHERSQRVLLWVDVWKRGMVSVDECLLMKGKPFCPDPTNPKYIARLRGQIKQMLSSEPGCYNADGFKIDGTSLQPYGYAMKTHSDKYGFELQKSLLKLIYDQAKAIKSDSLISTFVGNPYFADVCDMVRLGDMYTIKGDPYDSMKARARLIQIGMPNCLVDTDGQMRFSLRSDHMRLIGEQSKFGIPCIYNIERMLRSRTFCKSMSSLLTDEDYKQIAVAFDEYSTKLQS